MKPFFTLTMITLIIILGECRLIPETSEEDEIRDGQQKAEIVIRAVEQYKLDYGKYPNRLEDIVPYYLEQVPITVTGYLIDYYVDGDYYFVHFQLSKRGNLEAGCAYIRRLELWDCSYGAE